MILEPKRSAEEIEQRLSALNDPELAELLEDLKRGLRGDESESYTAESAPYWRRRIGVIALAGLFALSAGFASVFTATHSSVRAKPRTAAALPAARHHKTATRGRIAAKHTIVHVTPARVAPAIHFAPVVAPHEALVRQVRAQAPHVQHRVTTAMQASMAREWAQAEALAQARAEARAEAVESARAEDAAAQQRAHDQAVDQANGSVVRPSDSPPSTNGGITTYPNGAPLPLPGPVDTNCTPHRGSLFGTMLDHVRVGGVNVGGLLRLVGQ